LFFFVIFLFFFSSRRRHTRSKRDWSSDVCSSDLRNNTSQLPQVSIQWLCIKISDTIIPSLRAMVSLQAKNKLPTSVSSGKVPDKIGRASCRERVKSTVVTEDRRRKEERRS